ncbi:MAG TPA: trigger factor [Candidatus Acidoferrum sp.]|nr:trigger factor [Candidatus Acidoferrum sp.]
MKHTRHNNSPTNVKLTVTLDAADLATIKPKTLGRLSHKIKVPGFRPGKVPASVAEKHLEPNVLASELASDAINHFLVEALVAEQLQPLGQPQVEFSSYVPGQQLEFNAIVETLPKVTLGDYKHLKAKPQAAAVSDQEVDEIIDRMRRSAAKKQPVERAAQEGDEVKIDFSGSLGGVVVPGAVGKDYPLVLGSNSFIPGFEDGLIGKKTGEQFDLPLTFPKDYHSAELAGQEVVFAVTVHQISEQKLPELDDAFAATSGPFKTVAELQGDIRRELTEQKQREALDSFKQALLDELIAASDIPAPESLVLSQMDSQEQDFVRNLQYRGQTLGQYLDSQKLSRDEWRTKELRSRAERNVKIGLALAELQKLEDIKLATDKLDKEWAKILGMYAKDAKSKEELDTPDMKRDFANRLATEQVIDRLVELNNPEN